MEKIRLAVFDLDGTVSIKSGVSEEIEKGFNSLRHNQVNTTLVTGKILGQLNHRLGKKLDVFVSPTTPICTENGGRIALGSDNNLIYHPLRADEIRFIQQFVESHPIDIAAVAYQPEAGSSKMVAWSPKRGDLTGLIGRDLAITDVDTDSARTFFDRVLRDKPCMVTLAAKESNLSTELPSDVNVVENEGVLNINSSGVNKGQAVIQLSEYLQIPLSAILVAGNDENDIPMLRLPDIGRRIFVGNRCISTNLPEDTTRVETPEELGKLLLSY